MSDSDQITQLLRAVGDGREDAADELMPFVYEHLKRVAHAHLARERSGHTLQTTALVHEAYLKLAGADGLAWKDRAHFFATASRAMRRILIDYARARAREKRGGDRIQVPLEESLQIAGEHADDLLALDEALTRLEATNERMCRLVEHRFFAGMTLEETAKVLGVSLATVKRDWSTARAWLNHELSDEVAGDEA